MVNEEKVILMTRLAIYEQSSGKEDLEKAKYFKSDYVKYNCLKTLVSTTVLFCVIAASYVYYNVGDIIENLVDMDYLSIAYKLLLIYGISCLAFMLFAWLIYTVRYYKAKPKLIKYNQNLKKLIELYNKEDKIKSKSKRRKK
jgi:uncharacterized membrane protein YciS (DUF1049 family)